MRKTQRFHCTHAGCTWSHWSEEAARMHDAEPHVTCPCGRVANRLGARRHMRRCSVCQYALEDDYHVCSGCKESIVEGQQFFVIPELLIRTRTPTSYIAAREAPETPIKNLRFCTPLCFIQWAADNERMRDVFSEELVDG